MAELGEAATRAMQGAVEAPADKAPQPVEVVDMDVEATPTLAGDPAGGTFSMMNQLRSQLQFQAEQVRDIARERAAAAAEQEEARLQEEAVQKHKEAAEASPFLGVEQDRERFVGGWYEVVKGFVDNPESTEYQCPADLTGYDRKMLHQLAEQFNLGHKSHGKGRDRRLKLTKDSLFYEHGGLLPSKQRIAELAGWTDMRREFNPLSGKYTEATVEEVERRREYVPLDMEEEIKRSTQMQRKKEDDVRENQRLKRMRALNSSGVYDDLPEAGPSSSASGPPNLPPTQALQGGPYGVPTHPQGFPQWAQGGHAPHPQPVMYHQPHHQPHHQPPALPVAPQLPVVYAAPAPALPAQPAYAVPMEGGRDAKRRRVASEPAAAAAGGGGSSDPMQAFLQSGLAPKTVKVIRHTATEPLGIKFTKDLLITAVTGACERSGVPTDIFVTEVEGKDVSSVQEFTQAVRGRLTFSLTLWYLRKDGSTVDKLAVIAKKAEEALQAAVEGTTITTMQTCTVCESSLPLKGERWVGTRQQPCEACEQITPWSIEEFDDRGAGADDGDDDNDGQEKQQDEAPSVGAGGAE